MTTSNDLPFRALHVPEPRLVFGFNQSDRALEATEFDLRLRAL
jgi:hypothetical protein